MVYFPVSKAADFVPSSVVFEWRLFWLQVLKRCLVLLLFLSCFVLDNSLPALGSMVGFEARTINEYTTVSVAEK